MRTLILAAGRFGAAARAEIDKGREPRLDVFEIAAKLDADLIDFLDVDKTRSAAARIIARSAGHSAAVAYLGYLERNRYDAVLTTGEDIGLPLATLLLPSAAHCAHTMITHTLFPAKKRVFFKVGVAARIQRLLVYSTTEEQLATGELGIAPEKVERIYYHADQQFFRPDGRETEPDLICAAGQLLRDYGTLVEAVRGLPVKVQIAAGSPWIERPLEPQPALPPNVMWGKLPRFELRELYARSAIAVVPILQNEYQTGIATILEMMSMGKCVIATRTRGQTDTIVDGETGVYVPPADPLAMRTAIQRMLAAPEQVRQIGQAARRFIEANASLDRFVDRIAETVRSSVNDGPVRLRVEDGDPKTARSSIR